MRGVFWGIGFVRLSARATDLEHEVFLCKTAMSVPSIAVPESWHKNAPDTLSLAPTRFFRDKMAGATGIEPVISYDTPIANVHLFIIICDAGRRSVHACGRPCYRCCQPRK
jgi:hypothetical protein